MPASISSQHPESDFHALGNPSRFRWVGKRSRGTPSHLVGRLLIEGAATERDFRRAFADARALSS
jgi:hypothetical protein